MQSSAVLASGILAGLVAFAFPMVAGQNIWTVVELEGHAAGHEIELDPKTGQMTLPIVVRMGAGNFTCPQPTHVSVAVSTDRDPDYAYPAWGAGPVNPAPASVTFTIPAGEPGTQADYPFSADKKLDFELEWSTEHRPSKDARVTYKIGTYDSRFEPDGRCVPNNIRRDLGHLLVVVYMPDRQEEPDDCERAPELPECHTEEPQNTTETPATGAGLLPIAAAGPAWLARRRLG